MAIQYSKKIDAVIYGSCKSFTGRDFIDLAIAAADQASVPWDELLTKVIESLETIRDGREGDK